MQQLMAQLQAYSTQSMNDPSAGFAPIRQAGLDNINRTYMDVPNQVASQLAARGYGSSGSMGNSLYRVALQRGGAVSDFEGNLASKAIDQRNTGASLAQQLLSLNRGTTTTGTTPDTSLSNAFGTGGSALSNISALMMFNNYLKGQNPQPPMGEEPAGTGGVPSSVWGQLGLGPQ
jgi:hypothetical protein